MGKYRGIGGFGRMRTFRRWVVVVDGEEFPFVSKRLAILSGRAALSCGLGTKLLEETNCRFVQGGTVRTDRKFRIDISNILNYE